MENVDDYILRAASLHEQGRLQEAIEILKEAKALRPDKPEVHFNLGLYYGLLGDPVGAADFFQEAVRLRPDWADAHIYLIAYKLEAGEIETALELLEHALNAFPNNESLTEQHAIAMERRMAMHHEKGTSTELQQAIGYLQSATSNLNTISNRHGKERDAEEVRRQIELISRVRGAVELAERSLAIEHAMAFNRSPYATEGRHFPGYIILTTMPKSGSEYVWMALTSGLNLKPTRISSAQVLEVIDEERIDIVSKGGFVVHGHIRCTEINSILLSKYVDRLVVHVRDPRQALISWVYYQDHEDMKSLTSGKTWVKTTDERLQTQMEYFINGFYSEQISFLHSWMDAEKDRDFTPRILFTRQEDLRSDPHGFFTRLLDFHEIDPEIFRLPEPPRKGARHFRRGETDEWRHVLSATQITRIQEMLPDKTLERFGWPR